ncbi:hypothetical protein PGQ11_002865 [Apiospora arundinis]|uniref:Uncharacterized protein n=1 Tax=Apiospora arundinis TaxID=335852 RepID=A0ABR2J413_9PEZI
MGNVVDGKGNFLGRAKPGKRQKMTGRQPSTQGKVECKGEEENEYTKEASPLSGVHDAAAGDKDAVGWSNFGDDMIYLVPYLLVWLRGENRLREWLFTVGLEAGPVGSDRRNRL